MNDTACMPSRREALRDVLTATLALAGASLVPADARAQLSREIHLMTHPVRTGNLRDFDFLVGSWNVANRRLRRRWVGSDEWDEFPATSRCTQHLRGVVNVEELVMPTLDSSGLTLRTFDLAQRRWAIYWISSRAGVLFPPVYGGFDGERGEFYGDDTDDGRAVKVRFVWTHFARTTGATNVARWEQAYSRDGRTWETNWVMDFRRA